MQTTIHEGLELSSHALPVNTDKENVLTSRTENLGFTDVYLQPKSIRLSSQIQSQLAKLHDQVRDQNVIIEVKVFEERCHDLLNSSPKSEQDSFTNANGEKKRSMLHARPKSQLAVSDHSDPQLDRRIRKGIWQQSERRYKKD